MYYVYILYSASRDRFYIGSTGNLGDRIKRHNEGRSRYTKSGIPWKVVYQEEFETRAEAYQRERQIKAQKSREFIEELIAA